MGKADSHYSVEEVGGKSKFFVSPMQGGAKILLPALLAWIPVLFVQGIAQMVFFALAGILPSFMQMGLAIAFVVVVAYAWYRSFKFIRAWLHERDIKTRHAYDKTFFVSGTHIELPGVGNFQFSDISRLALKNAMDGSVNIPMQNFVVAGRASTVAVGVAAGAINNAVIASINIAAQRAATINYQVVLETGGKQYMITGGLTEVCASGLLFDIGRAQERHANAPR